MAEREPVLYLVILNDENEAHVVTQMFSKHGKMPSSWVGLQYSAGQDEWRSVQGHTMDQLYNVWHKYMKHHYTKEGCGLLNSDGELFDYYCNYYYAFICERDII